MKLRIGLLLVIFIGLALGCGSSSKTPDATADSKLLEEMVAQKSFEIHSDWASPLVTTSVASISNAGLLPPGSTANRISLIGNSNYFKVMGDSVSAYLPYYGERQFGGGYNSDGGAIRFKGVPRDYEITTDENTKIRELRFQIKDKTENYRVLVQLYPNLTSNINVNSSHRLSIRYGGTVAPISEE